MTSSERNAHVERDEAGTCLVALPKSTLLPLWSVLESLLFVSDSPRSVSELQAILADALAPEPPPERAEIDSALNLLRERYDASGSAVQLRDVAGGYELRTRSMFAPWLQPLYKRKPQRLGRAALEVLAIVAYRQPCTRAEVDEVRGVDSSSTLRNLLGLKLLRIIGRADDVGRPLVYGTSDEFLRFFGLKSLADLPTLREFSELSEEHMLTLAELDRMRESEDEDGQATDEPQVQRTNESNDG